MTAEQVIINVGDRVVCGSGSDRDYGKVWSIDREAGTAIVGWDSGVSTPADLADLRHSTKQYSGGSRVR